MTTPGLTNEGFVALRSADYLERIRQSYEGSTGLTLDWTRERFLGNISAIMAQQLGELGEASQALYDAFDVNNATGVMLENLCALVGIERRESTFSTIPATLTGTPGTTIPAGRQVSGGGPFGKSRWETTEEVVLDAFGDADVVIRALEDGPVEAAAGEVDTIITPIDGWEGISHVAPATQGLERESDGALRIRRQSSLQVAGSTSASAIRAELLALATLEAVTLLENDGNSTQLLAGVEVLPHGLRPVLWTGNIAPALTDDQLEEIARTLHEHVSAGVRVQGDDVQTLITGTGLIARKIQWDWASTLVVDLAIALELAPGYALEDVEARIIELVSAYFGALSVGGAVRLLAIYAILYTVEGLESAGVTLNGAGLDVEPTLTQVAALGTLTITAP